MTALLEHVNVRRQWREYALSVDLLRTALRAHTAHIHEQLDRTVGSLASDAAYRGYVRRTHAFRARMEPSLASQRGWRPLSLAPLLLRDLDDLGQSPMTAGEDCPAPASPARLLGRLYVLEGSSVGARLLYRRAQALGFSADHGARHLAAQSGDVERWRQFLHLLEADTNLDRHAVLAGAMDAFQFALAIYSEPADEPA